MCVILCVRVRACVRVCVQEYLSNSDYGIFSFDDLVVYDRVCDQGLVLSDETINTGRLF
jgi:hypothetical protein